MAQRRGRYGDGAVYQMADGTWRGCVDLGTGPRDRAGALRRTCAPAPRARPTAKVRALREQVRGGEVTVKAQRAASPWPNGSTSGCPARPSCGSGRTCSAATPRLSATTSTPRSAAIPLNRLTPEQVEALYAELATKGLSPRTVVFVHRVLGRAIKVANQRGYVARNVVRLVELETPHGRSGVALRADEARAVLAASRDLRDHARWVVALGLGRPAVGGPGHALGRPRPR